MDGERNDSLINIIYIYIYTRKKGINIIYTHTREKRHVRCYENIYDMPFFNFFMMVCVKYLETYQNIFLLIYIYSQKRGEIMLSHVCKIKYVLVDEVNLFPLFSGDTNTFLFFL